MISKYYISNTTDYDGFTRFWFWLEDGNGSYVKYYKEDFQDLKSMTPKKYLSKESKETFFKKKYNTKEFNKDEWEKIIFIEGL